MSKQSLTGSAKKSAENLQPESVPSKISVKIETATDPTDQPKTASVHSKLSEKIETATAPTEQPKTDSVHSNLSEKREIATVPTDQPKTASVHSKLSEKIDTATVPPDQAKTASVHSKLSDVIEIVTAPPPAPIWIDSDEELAALNLEEESPDYKIPANSVVDFNVLRGESDTQFFILNELRDNDLYDNAIFEDYSIHGEVSPPQELQYYGENYSVYDYSIYSDGGEAEAVEEAEVEVEVEHVCGCVEKIPEEVEPSASDVLYDSLVNYQLYESKDSDSVRTSTDEPELKFADKKFSPFQLTWGFGINLNVPILNLTDETRKVFFFVCSHKGIFYDYLTEEMTYIDGHPNHIQSASVDATGRWLATSDVGPNSVIMITDTLHNNPVRLIYNEPEDSAVLLAISPDAKYLITVTRPDNPRIDLWIWTLGNDTPDDSYVCSVKRAIGLPKQIAFHPNDCRHIMVAFEKQIIFLKIDEENMKFFPPVIPKLKTTAGTITGCSFADRCHECFATTTEGYIMIFSKTTYSEDFGENAMDIRRRFIKLIKVASGVTSIINVDNMLVCTNSQGSVGYYDKNLKLLNLIVPNKNVPFVKSVSFQRTPRKFKLEDPFNFDNQFFQIGNMQEIIEKYEDKREEYEVLYENLVPSMMSITHKPFIIRTFIAGTGDGNLYFVDVANQIYRPLFHPCDPAVVSIDCSDENPHIAIAYKHGRVSVYNYMTHELLVTNVIGTAHSHDSEQDCTTCIKYSPQTLHLCLGKNNGQLWILDALLQPLDHISVCPVHTIRKLCFSHDAKYLALFNNSKTVFLFKYVSHKWTSIGKQRSHYKAITDIMFIDTDPLKLYTIGEDRYLVEYKVDQGEEQMSILSRIRIEQSAIPLCFLNYQSPETNKKYILIANDQQKYSIYHEESKMCRSIILGPSHGCYGKFPLKKIMNLPGSLGKYIIFANENHLGIQKLPPDGSPYKYIGLLGNPALHDFAISGSGEYVFTCGQNDQSVLMWKVQTECVPVLQKIGGAELSPYYCLIEGGENGWYFKEIQDLFCYMQILQQGDFYHEQKFGEYVATTEVPDLMRACGFYPTEFQIENIMNEVKYKDFDRTGVLQTQIHFVEFVKLFINHRPAHGVTMDELEEHFKALLPKFNQYDYYYAKNSNKATVIAELCSRGEAFKEVSLNNCFKVLMGNTLQQKDRGADNVNVTQLIPDEFDFDYFKKNILGIVQDSNYEELQTRKQST